MLKRKRRGLLALALSAALLPCPALSGGVALGVAGCGDGCFDCRDSGCGCKSGEICSESEQLPASMSPEAVGAGRIRPLREKRAAPGKDFGAQNRPLGPKPGQHQAVHHTVWACKSEEKKAP